MSHYANFGVDAVARDGNDGENVTTPIACRARPLLDDRSNDRGDIQMWIGERRNW